jgi:hypothetical protein
MTMKTKTKPLECSLSFAGQAGDAIDTKVEALLKRHGAEAYHWGTFLSTPPERDIEFSVDRQKLGALKGELYALGVKIEETV